MKGLQSEFETLKELLKDLFKHGSGEAERRVRIDLDRVAAASRILQISEFRFFHIAYAEWYGSEINDHRMEIIFSEYMFDDIVPHWVRHFTRRVMSRCEEGRLDPKEFHIESPRATLELKSAGYGYSVILAVIVILFCIMLTGHIPPQ